MADRPKAEPGKLEPRSVEPLLPLSPVMFHVLLALSEGDFHGYGIVKEVARLTNGAFSVSTGTLYAILRRLESEGMVVERKDRPAAELDDERRRYYHLTEFGRRVACAEAERLRGMLALAWDRNLLAKPEGV
jgi:DNA-binding PadR family transcriptional regulator